jgi:DNA-binding transcriptional regulator YiaG
MNPIARIRKEVFGLSQAAMAELIGVSQATVSRWEAGKSSPNRAALGHIRSCAIVRRLPWDDRWLFADIGMAAE